METKLIRISQEGIVLTERSITIEVPSDFDEATMDAGLIEDLFLKEFHDTRLCDWSEGEPHDSDEIQTHIEEDIDSTKADLELRAFLDLTEPRTAVPE